MRTEIIQESTAAPILLEEVKDHLRIDGEQEDSSLSSLIAASVKMLESYTDLVLTERKLNVFYDGIYNSYFQENWAGGMADGVVPTLSKPVEIPLLVRPLLSVDAVAIRGENGDETLLANADYTATSGLRPSVFLRRTISAKANLRIAVTVGFGPSWNNVPADIRHALLLMTAVLYTDRGDTPGNMVGLIKRCGAEALLLPYRRVRI